MKSKRKTKAPTIKALDAKIWPLCREIIRKKYGNTCFTCGKKNLVGRDWQTGHFIAKKICGSYLRHDLRNLRPQCSYCNEWLGGNGADFYKRLVETEGQKYVDLMFADKHIVCKLSDRVNELLPIYQKLAKEL